LPARSQCDGKELVTAGVFGHRRPDGWGLRKAGERRVRVRLLVLVVLPFRDAVMVVLCAASGERANSAVRGPWAGYSLLCTVYFHFNRAASLRTWRAQRELWAPRWGGAGADVLGGACAEWIVCQRQPRRLSSLDLPRWPGRRWKGNGSWNYPFGPGQTVKSDTLR